jgi:hypothetical protein
MHYQRISKFYRESISGSPSARLLWWSHGSAILELPSPTTKQELIVTKKPNHNADIKNPNQGTRGTNKTWDKAQGNRGKQLNPSRPGQNIPLPKPRAGA